MKKAGWILFGTLASIIGLYPIIYFIVPREFGLLSSKSDALLTSTLWNIGFYTHIIPGGIALLIGWIQFSSKIRFSRPKLHRNIGKVYVASVLFSSLAGIYVGFYATGGIVSSLGFISLGIIWFSTTSGAFLAIKNGNLTRHQNLMTYSYAACFAAVTLRILLPVLVMTFKDFITAYTIVSWLCWVPNLIVAKLIIEKSRGRLSISKI